MLKRLIEVALPLREVSVQSAREKLTRHNQISTLHIWWARRPLAACRAAVFASLIPDPDDPDCPESFRKLVMDLLSRAEFKPKNSDGAAAADTPRNRCLEFVKFLVILGNSDKPEYIEPARELIAAAHKLLHPTAKGDIPCVLDPFAGGGAIPLEALRLGSDAHAIDINPVAHLIELCTLVYPQKYGQPTGLPAPDYIKRVVARNRLQKERRLGGTLFARDDGSIAVAPDEIIPEVEITEAEHRKNPLSADSKYWGAWLHEMARQELARYYPPDSDGCLPLAYLWARTIECSNPSCNATIPLFRSLWLCNKPRRKAAMRLVVDDVHMRCRFEIALGASIDFDPTIATMKAGKARCPFCATVHDGHSLRTASIRGKLGTQLMAVVLRDPEGNAQHFRCAKDTDYHAVSAASTRLTELIACEGGHELIPNEQLPTDRPAPNARGLSGVVRYGFDRFGMLFSHRQTLSLATFVHLFRMLNGKLQSTMDVDYRIAVMTVLGVSFGRAPDAWSQFCVWNPTAPTTQHAFGRQALGMVWDFSEVNPFGGSAGDWRSSINWNTCNAVLAASKTGARPATCVWGTATRLPYPDQSIDCVITDPPYYESVPYADLSDFFYVWIKRVLRDVQPDVLRSPLTPKRDELIAYYGGGKRTIQKPPEWYEEQMSIAFAEIRRALSPDGIAAVMFAHKTTSAWEKIIGALCRSGLVATASWPIHTENKTRMVAMGTAALASSVTLVCRSRSTGSVSGLWDDVRQDLQSVAKERLDFFWSQGIRGADFFISAIGPALSVFGQYERVTKLSGEAVTVGQFLDEVRSLVTNYALGKILKTTQTGAIDPESRFYVVWRWSYGEAKVPADESFKLAQALGTGTESMWDKSGVLEKAGENVQAVPIAKRMKLKDLGEPAADGVPASLIDVLHRLCMFRDKGDTPGMAEFLGRSGQAGNPSLWLVAQAVSEILPDGNKEKQLMQGLLNQREALEQEQGRLF